MGKRGPAPTPTAKLKLGGSWRANANKSEPQPPPGVPECPEYLDPVAQAMWSELAPSLLLMGVLSVIDRNSLARYCRTWSRWRRADDWIEENGETFTTDKGYVGQVPQVAICHNLAAQLTKLEAEFGMTPSGRTRIRVDSTKPVRNESPSLIKLHKGTG